MSTRTFREAIRDALREEMQRDKDIYLLGEDIGLHGGAFFVTQGLIKEFGEKRVKDTPLAESSIVGVAIGASLGGLRPVAEVMFCDFFTVCMDPIINQAAKLRYMFGGKVKLPVVIRTTFGARLSAAAQHSQSLEAWFTHIPGLKVVMPSNPYDAKGLLKSAIRDDNVVLFFEHKYLYDKKGEVPEGEYIIPLGVADIKRKGKDVTIVATGYMVHVALSAGEKLSKDGIEVEIIDPRTLSPLDKGTIINSIKKTGRLIVVSEEHKNCALTSEISAMVAEEAYEFLVAPIKRVNTLDVPIPFNPKLETFVLPDEEKVIQAVRKTLKYKSSTG